MLAPVPVSSSAVWRVDGVVPLGFDAAEAVIVDSGGQPARIEAGRAERLAFFRQSDDDQPPSTLLGAAPDDRSEHTWLAADNGLYSIQGRFVLSADPVLRPQAPVAVPDGALSGTWWAEARALVRLPDLETIDASALGAITGMAFGGDEALVIADGALWILARDGDGYSAEPLAYDGDPVAVEYAQERWWVSDASGRLASLGDGWSLRALPEPAVQLAEGADGALWIRTETGRILRLRVEEVLEDPSIRADVMVASARGSIVTSDGMTVSKWTRGDVETVTFTEDVLPWLQSNCIACHAAPDDFGDYSVFTELAADALERVRTGDMPRCGVALCPEEQRLTPDDYGVLEAWISAGLPQ